MPLLNAVIVQTYLKYYKNYMGFVDFFKKKSIIVCNMCFLFEGYYRGRTDERKVCHLTGTQTLGGVTG